MTSLLLALPTLIDQAMWRVRNFTKSVLNRTRDKNIDILMLLPHALLAFISAMLPLASEITKRQAANIVLARPGEEMIDAAKYHLRRSNAISFESKDPSVFMLDQLHFGLSVLLGEGSANNILKQINDEIKELLETQMH